MVNVIKLRLNPSLVFKFIYIALTSKKKNP